MVQASSAFVTGCAQYIYTVSLSKGGVFFSILASDRECISGIAMYEQKDVNMLA